MALSLPLPLQLETDKSLIMDRAIAALRKNHTHAIIANLVHTRKREAWLISSYGCQHLAATPGNELEYTLTEQVDYLHTLHLQKRVREKESE